MKFIHFLNLFSDSNKINALQNSDSFQCCNNHDKWMEKLFPITLKKRNLFIMCKAYKNQLTHN